MLSHTKLFIFKWEILTSINIYGKKARKNDILASGFGLSIGDTMKYYYKWLLMYYKIIKMVTITRDLDTKIVLLRL